MSENAIINEGRKPRKVLFDMEKQTSTLYFSDGSNGDYRMRGGVCWPMSVERTPGNPDIEGFILMAGQNVDTGKVFIFEQRTFVVIDHIVNQSGVIEYEGISSWINKCWSKYYARDFFWNQTREHAKSYRLEVIRSKMIDPKPQFIEVGWGDVAEVKHTVWRLVKTGKIWYEKGSQLHEELDLIKKGQIESVPSVHAMMCLAYGLERYPIR
ncbi:MAG: hypothetical protein GY841_23585 [FCB group bacterium]|nr:hypothetical protein [FCB group bacterium]